MKTSRRNLLLGLGAMMAAPAIIKFDALMPIKIMRPLRTTLLQFGLGPHATLTWRALDPIDAFVSNNELSEFLRGITIHNNSQQAHTFEVYRDHHDRLQFDRDNCLDMQYDIQIGDRYIAMSSIGEEISCTTGGKLNLTGERT